MSDIVIVLDDMASKAGGLKFRMVVGCLDSTRGRGGSQDLVAVAATECGKMNALGAMAPSSPWKMT